MIEIGRVVYSKAGSDKGNFAAVVGTKENAVLISDGKRRTLEHPKAKNPKHLGLTSAVLDNGSMTTNKALRCALKKFGAEQNV